MDGLGRRVVSLMTTPAVHFRYLDEAAATSSNSTSRVLLIGYGQSNMSTFFTLH